MDMPGTETPALTALDMARNLAATIEPIARASVADPLGSHIGRQGDRGHAAAELAANLALVSLAEDVRRIADHLDASRYRP